MRPGELDPALLTRLAAEHGTPLFVYHAGTVRDRIAALGAFDRVRYAQKANPNLSLLALIRGCGAAVDAVSEGELRRALRAGFAPEDIRYTADAFEDGALALAAGHGLALNVGSADMLEAAASAQGAGELWLRVNPGFGHGHGPKVKTGGPDSKHGIWHAELPAAIARARELGLTPRGLHVHIGSGSDLEHLARVPEAVEALAPHFGQDLCAISAGGGLPIPHRPEDPPFELAAWTAFWQGARERIEAALGRRIELEVEPGRYVVGESGVLLTRVLGTKRTGAHELALVDAGFHTLLRPAFYGAYHHIELVGEPRGPLAPRAVAGPLCESADLLTIDARGVIAPRLLPPLARGDLLCVHDTGAYGAAMSSNYNARPFAAEVLVDGDEARVIRRRQTFEATIADEL